MSRATRASAGGAGRRKQRHGGGCIWRCRRCVRSILKLLCRCCCCCCICLPLHPPLLLFAFAAGRPPPRWQPRRHRRHSLRLRRRRLSPVPQVPVDELERGEGHGCRGRGAQEVGDAAAVEAGDAVLSQDLQGAGREGKGERAREGEAPGQAEWRGRRSRILCSSCLPAAEAGGVWRNTVLYMGTSCRTTGRAVE